MTYKTNIHPVYLVSFSFFFFLKKKKLHVTTTNLVYHMLSFLLYMLQVFEF